ncbi:unnamed protein product [Prorocentrum cordatum]|uniref:Uncharacterized protein n=1 Tax=Prorocentrum cordatum TaxID=2364126 RepID=A0ABN9QEW4_9DINO|nr:unnamed protein product [Polarella glacialis]
MAAGARAALRALLALLCCGAPCAVGGVALRPRAGPGDVKVPRVRLPGGGGAMPMAGLGLPKCEPDAAVGGDCREKAPARARRREALELECARASADEDPPGTGYSIEEETTVHT